ncbi:hypothetical protein [Actinocatenispora rupis]|uniref:Uncharacterized protein n=1 Tax=Actinocatenispora rupis TaxID=519421 RepID=A0A8J3NC56_9ACTN|nr:hypothetical protein [Actinocatenispora rupis]GID11377.1 hypothetical protein Aru02nite_22660 [Actinocatenispora rupis]
MGTSASYPGPVGGSSADNRTWKRTRQRLTALGKQLDKVLHGPGGVNAAQQLLRDRQDDIAADLATGLRLHPSRVLLAEPITARARALVDTLDRLQLNGLAGIGVVGASPDERELQFMAAFLGDRSTGTVPDYAVRRGLRSTIDTALRDNAPLRQAVRSGNAGYRPPRDLFCAIFQMFFADAVRAYLRTVVAEHLKIALPVLYLDPTGLIADTAAKKLVSLVPNPCEEEHRRAGPHHDSLAGTARSLVVRAVSQILDLDEPGVEAA